MIPHEDHLQPEYYPPLVKALAAVHTRSGDIPVPIRDVWDPERCPEPFLKLLAHAFSVDLWVDDWPERRKRNIIARAVQMHRQKGTLAGILSYLEFVDVSLKGYEVPPKRIFSGPSLTRQEREEWLSALPQVRTWRIRERGSKGFALFSGGRGYSSFFETGFTIPSTAMDRLRRRARWVVDGVETETRVSEFGNYFRLHVKSTAGKRVVSGVPIHGRFLLPSTADQRIITVQPTPRLPWRSAVGPRLDPVTSEPERVKVKGTTEFGVFSGRFLGAGYFRPSSAALRIFWRFAVHDGRQVNRRKTIQFMGVGRFGFPAHTAHLTLSMPSKRPKWAAGEGIVRVGQKFWLPHNPERSRNARQALLAAQRASDRVMVRYAGIAQIIAGQPFRAGIDSFVIGQPSRG